MSQTVFGAAAVVTFLNRAFHNTTPGHLIFQNQVKAAGSTAASQTAFAAQFGASFATLSDAALAHKVLGNMGVLPNADLEAALVERFAAVGTDGRGLLVWQLGQILVGLEGAGGSLAAYAPAAAAWNHAITQSYLYSVDPTNTVAIDPLADMTAPVVSSATFSYAENQAAGYGVGTVAATDGVGVTAFEIATGNSSGYFAIDAAGNITLTEAGAAATAANDYETAPNAFALGVVAKDAAGNTSAVANMAIQVTDVDDVAPKLLAAAAVGTTVKLNFNEAFKAGAIVYATAFNVVDAANTSIGVGSVTVSGSQVILTLAALPSGAVKVSYAAPAIAEALQDAAGNKVADIVGQLAVADITAPTLLSSNPADDSSTLAAASNLALTFSENVVLGAGFITLVNTIEASDTRTIAITDAAQVSVAGAVLTINPTANLKVGASYYVNVPATAVFDAAGNPYAGISNVTGLNFTVLVPPVPGETLIFTTAIDLLTGTAGDDTIIGVFSTSPPGTLSVVDRIRAGAGMDTLKMYGTYDVSQMPDTITGVEVLQLVIAANAALDLSSSLYSKAVSGIEKVIIDDAVAINGQTITTTTGQSLSLATGTTGAGTAGAVTWSASSTDAVLNLALNGYQSSASAGAVQSLTVSNTAASTVQLASTGAANKVSTLTLGAQTSKLVITGDKALTVSTNFVSSGGAGVLKVVDASASTGSVGITVAAGTTAAFAFAGGAANDSLTLAAAPDAAFAFSGGAGNDNLKLADNGLQALASGAQLDGGAGSTDKISLNDGALLANEYTALNAAKNFEVLGLIAAVTVDASQLAGYKIYSLDGNAAQVINQVATGTTVNLTTSHATDITVAAAVGVNDLAFNIGASTVGGNLTLSGFSLVALGSNSNSTINHLILRDNAVVTITGSKDLTITAVADATTTGHKIDGTALTGKLNVTANQAAYAANSMLGDILIGGSNTDTLKAGLNSTKLTGNAGNDIFDVSLAVAGATAHANITTITDLAKGDAIKFGSTAGAFTATKVDLSGAVSEQAALDALLVGNDSDVKWGVYNGNTYIVDDVGAGNTMEAADTIVKLAGVLNLSASTFASQVLLLA
ncbi:MULTISPECIES: Ig-like domain-containing protein [Giesbergeria]|uniref:Ig-like domain-containing protein n=1 Tax=Giesbergeria sinuosa TaxID=80883 RepID=A0ABV9QB89_9BURK